MEFPEAMWLARKNARLTIRELSQKSGVAKNTLWSWERGFSVPRIDSAVLVADVLGISVDEYIGHKVKRREKN